MFKDSKPKKVLNEIEKISSFGEILLKNAKLRPEASAFCYVENGEDKIKTYREFYEDALSLGTALARLGYHKAHIAMIGENCYEWALTQMTVLASDNVFVSIDKEASIESIINCINQSDTNLVFCTGDLAQTLTETRSKMKKVEKFFVYRPKTRIVGDFIDAKDLLLSGYNAWYFGGDSCFDNLIVDPNTLAEIVYTSSTTDDPKGVCLSRNAILSNIYSGLSVQKLRTKALSVVPFSNLYGSNCDILASLYIGSTICINNTWDELESDLKKYQPDYIMLVPSLADRLYNDVQKALEDPELSKKFEKNLKLSENSKKLGIDLKDRLFGDLREILGGQLRLIICGTAPLRPQLAEFFETIGISLLNGYGLTECGPLVSVNHENDNIFASAGVLIPGVSVKIEKPEEDHEEGEIFVKGDSIMLGYYNDFAKTRSVLSNDGWLATGDLGRMTGDRLYITGRKKNIIALKNGRKVCPEEIENYLKGIYGADEIVVYGLKDDFGEEYTLCAEVHPNTDFGQDKNIIELTAYFKEKVFERCEALIDYKKITEVVIRRTDFPHTTSGKIKRLEVLRQRGLR